MDAETDLQRQRFLRQLPKIELHAHLNGSIRRSTLQFLAASKGINLENALILTRSAKTLSEAFDVFRVIHSCVGTLQDVERLAYELGQDLEEDGMVYAEIRTTPRAVNTTLDHLKVEAVELDRYVQAVLDGFSRYSQTTLASQSSLVILRLLLSIDRAKHSPLQARAIVKLAHRHRHAGVVGIDLSGDPTKGGWSDFEPALAYARSIGLKVTLHAGEVRDMDQEMEQMLDFQPDRLGYVVSSRSGI